jgi:hypothetical protein
VNLHEQQRHQNSVAFHEASSIAKSPSSFRRAQAVPFPVKRLRELLFFALPIYPFYFAREEHCKICDCLCVGPVSGVGLGPSCYTASRLWFPGSRPLPVFRSAICDCLSLNVFGFSCLYGEPTIGPPPPPTPPPTPPLTTATPTRPPPPTSPTPPGGSSTRARERERAASKNCAVL